MKCFAVIFVLLFEFHLAQGQEPAEGEQEEEKIKNYGIEWSLHTGPLLPNLIEGMDEILMSWGPRFGWPTSRGRLEISLLSGRGEGIEYMAASVSLRGDLRFEDLTGIFYLGADGHQYTYPAIAPTTIFVAGGHVGTGILAHIGGDVWFRSDMKFNLNPGTALYFGFGIMIRAPAGGGAEGSQERVSASG